MKHKNQFRKNVYFGYIRKAFRLTENADRYVLGAGIILSGFVFVAPFVVPQAEAMQQLFDNTSKAIFLLVVIFSILSFSFRHFLGQNPFQFVFAAIGRDYFTDRMEQDWYNLFKRGQISFWRGILKPVRTERELEIFNRLNAEAFVSTQSFWSYGYDLVAARNKTLHAAEQNIFKFVCNKERKIIGFSFIIPVGSTFRDLYVSGKIHDSQITGEFVPRRDEKLAAFILFAVGRNYLKDQFDETGGEDSTFFALVYMRALALHLKELMAVYKVSDVELIVQPEKFGIMRLLRRYGFKRVGEKSADGFFFYSAQVSEILATIESKGK